jgi:hypothetical protein
VQNNRVHRDEACFTCHTTYALYGDIKAKIGGLRHIAVNYLGAPAGHDRLYKPYNNRECLHCHEGARSFESSDAHTETDTTMTAIKANRLSCMSSGCHDLVHDVTNLGQARRCGREPLMTSLLPIERRIRARRRPGPRGIAIEAVSLASSIPSRSSCSPPSGARDRAGIVVYLLALLRGREPGRGA